MDRHIVKINSIKHITHDVLQIVTEKPRKYIFAPGQATEVSINKKRYLKSKNEIGNNKLIFANKTKDDIILEQEFKKLLGKNFINILSGEKADGYAQGHITEGFLKAIIIDLNKNIYICGPPPMMAAIEKLLTKLHVDEQLIVKEAF